MLRGLVLRQAFKVIDLVFAALVGTVVFMVIMKNIEGPETPAEAARPVALTNEDLDLQFASVGPRSEYDIITESGIFGPAAGLNRDATPPEPPPKEEPPEETETQLPLKLLGEVFAGDQQRIATALIEVSRGNRRLDTFYVGEEILDGVFLHEVRSKEVVLDNKNSGQLEVLKRDTSPDRFQVAAASRPSPEPDSSSQAQRSTTSNVIALDRKELSQDLVENYEEIATTLDIREYVDESGNVAGLTAPNVSDIELANKLGLQDNDVLTSINNEPIESVDKVYDVLNKYRNASTFRLGILRGGRPMYVTYRLR